MPDRITALIVTYNRKKELLRCVKAVLEQTHKITDLVIVDNASTDGTLEMLSDNGVLSANMMVAEQINMLGLYNGIKIHVIRKEKNTGGSGGFYSGMSAISENLEYDYLWMMDDDGYPSKNCLQLLYEKTDTYDYIMPVSIDIDNHERLSWSLKKKNGKKTISYEELCNSYGEILDYVTPFNGILLSRRIVDDVGFINPMFFLWGDEYDHYYRCVEKGYKPSTFLKAVFYHPAQKLPQVPIFFGSMHVPYVDSKLRMVCLARNYTYIYLHYRQQYKIILKFMQYTWLFLITRHLDLDGFRLYCLSVGDGFNGNFARHLKYL